ncbi:MAG: hypothetical protein DIU78_004475 [Pseudomonadota bacterium]|nr:MAG: hypothetical protein DIU78_23680 [Pseudomonadota bacterium]
MQAGVWVENIDWVLAHEELERIAKERAELDGREGLALLRAYRAEVHRHLGYVSFAQYVEKLFGYGFRTTDDKLRTAIALEGLPEAPRSHRPTNGGPRTRCSGPTWGDCISTARGGALRRPLQRQRPCPCRRQQRCAARRWRS